MVSGITTAGYSDHLDELARRDRCRVTDHGHEVALAARLELQDAEPALLVVEGHALDQPRVNLAMGRGRSGRNDIYLASVSRQSRVGLLVGRSTVGNCKPVVVESAHAGTAPVNDDQPGRAQGALDPPARLVDSRSRTRFAASTALT